MTTFESEQAEDAFAPTQRSRVKRLPQRGSYEWQVIEQILDEGLVAHVGFVANAQPFVIPTAYGRVGNCLYLHGSPASRMLRTLQTGIEVCVTVTLLDGLVLARSAFHHSMNYRSVVVFGTATLVQAAERKREALRAFTEHVVPGRWQDVRPPTLQEIQSTLVLSLSLDEASAKIRTGPPNDDEADSALPIWAGVIPLRLEPSLPVPAPGLSQQIPVPRYLQSYSPESKKVV